MNAPALLASRKQQAYVRRLLAQASARQLAHGLALDPQRLDWLTVAEAGAAIGRLKRLIAARERRRFVVSSAR